MAASFHCHPHGTFSCMGMGLFHRKRVCQNGFWGNKGKFINSELFVCMCVCAHICARLSTSFMFLSKYFQYRILVLQKGFSQCIKRGISVACEKNSTRQLLWSKTGKFYYPPVPGAIPLNKPELFIIARWVLPQVNCGLTLAWLGSITTWGVNSFREVILLEGRYYLSELPVDEGNGDCLVFCLLWVNLVWLGSKICIYIPDPLWCKKIK